MDFSNKIINGDCRVELNKLPDSFVQTIITSPPYWGLRDYGHHAQIGQEKNLDNYLLELSRVFDSVKRILRDDGVLWLNIGDAYTSGNRKYRDLDKKNNNRNTSFRPETPNGLKEKELIGIPWRLAFQLQSEGWFLRNDIIWHKPNAMPESVKDRPYRCHEYLFMFTKEAKYYFDQSYLKNDEKLLRSVWSINNRSRSTIHSATFPSKLVEYCIQTSSKENDVILDPFCGIGTVGRVANSLRRKFIGIEINTKFSQEVFEKY